MYLFRKPSVGEALGSTQAKRRISRRYHLRALSDPRYPLKNAQRRMKRRAGYYGFWMRLFRFALRMGR
jgi:hypothetical protein